MIVEGKKEEKTGGAPNMGGMEGMYWYSDYCSFSIIINI